MFEKRIINGLLEYYPHLKDKIDYTLVGSPLTFNHYIGSQQGEVYGMKIVQTDINKMIIMA